MSARLLICVLCLTFVFSSQAVSIFKNQRRQYSLVAGPTHSTELAENSDNLLHLSDSSTCRPKCINGGICSNGECFCRNYYTGGYCQTKAEEANPIYYLVIYGAIGLIIGWIIAYLIWMIISWCRKPSGQRSAAAVKRPEEGQGDQEVWENVD